MHLKSIEMEGFKSYATRTVVGPFDPCFNASKFSVNAKKNKCNSLILSSYRIQWFRKIKYIGCNLFCDGNQHSEFSSSVQSTRAYL